MKRIAPAFDQTVVSGNQGLLMSWKCADEMNRIPTESERLSSQFPPSDHDSTNDPLKLAPRRRQLLEGAVGLMVPFSGCLEKAFAGRQHVDLILQNYTNRRQPLKLELIPSNGDHSGDPDVLRREFEIPAPGENETAGTVTESNFVPQCRYIVRVLLKFGLGVWAHHHHVPSSASPEDIHIRVYRDADEEPPYVRFFP